MFGGSTAQPYWSSFNKNLLLLLLLPCGLVSPLNEGWIWSGGSSLVTSASVSQWWLSRSGLLLVLNKHLDRQQEGSRKCGLTFVLELTNLIYF